VFELRIAEAIVEEAELSQKLIREGFLHAFKAGELIEEVKSILHSEGEVEGWLESNCSQVERRVLKNCMKLYKGETVKVEATLKGDE
jgi:hypothetical protein